MKPSVKKILERRAARLGITVERLIERDKQLIKRTKVRLKTERKLKTTRKLYRENYEEFDKLPLEEKIKQWYSPLQSPRFSSKRTQRDYGPEHPQANEQHYTPMKGDKPKEGVLPPPPWSSITEPLFPEASGLFTKSVEFIKTFWRKKSP